MSIYIPRLCCTRAARPSLVPSYPRAQYLPRPFSRSLRENGNRTDNIGSDSMSGKAASELHQEPSREELNHFDDAVEEDKHKQVVTPWMRDGSDKPPVARQRSAGAMTKGKLLTTPSRMLKLVIPLTTRDANTDRKDVEPLALLVHPQQPLSYLQRLIQSELPTIKDDSGKEKIPDVHFRAESAPTQDEDLSEKAEEVDDEEASEDDSKLKEDADEMTIDGKKQKTGKLNEEQKDNLMEKDRRGGPGQGGVESYSGLGREAEESKDDEDRKFVRWSMSTEIGDFIRDAARGREIAIEIEGAPREILVGVPSFNDRTFYLRTRLRKKATEIARMADIKRECDAIAHRAAKRVAMGGGVILVAWWGLVYTLTFLTSLGWDVMEPVTYLAGLSTLIGGYGWFLVHNRQVSYRSAMNFTISRRQSQLYEQKGFDLRKWEDLIEEGNKLRNEIKGIAQEYDVEWDEKGDEKHEKVTEALKKDRQKKSEKKDDSKDEDDD